MAIFLYVALALLTIDGVIELGFITTMVGWLNRVAGAGFPISYPDNAQFLLAGKPKNFLVDQGHTANGAAGTAFIVVGLGGFLALALRHRQRNHGDLHGFTSFLYNFWLYFSAVSAIYSLAAFVYVFAVTYQHDNQTIDLQYASTLPNESYPNNFPYDRLTWTPQNWYPAVLDLPLAIQDDRDTIKFHLMLMKGWQWNIIPMTILGFVVATLAFADRMKQRQRLNKSHADSRLEASRQKPGSPWSQ